MSSPVRQPFLKKDFVTRLKAEVGANLPYYERETPWLAQYADGQAYELQSVLEPRVKLNLHAPDRAGRDLKDYENARLIYDAFPDLNAAQASDPRLWTYLTHVDCWTYMRQRWPLPDVDELLPARLRKGMSPPEAEKSAGAARVEFIKSHYFVGTGDSRSLTRNGIVGLWWFARLTYDSARSNPYELTGILLTRLDVTKNFIERSLGRNQNILRGFLKLLAEDGAVAGQVGDGERGRLAIRVLSRCLKAYGGVALLDQLDKSELKDLIRRCLKKIDPGDAINTAFTGEEAGIAPADENANVTSSMG